MQLVGERRTWQQKLMSQSKGEEGGRGCCGETRSTEQDGGRTLLRFARADYAIELRWLAAV